MIFFLDSVVPPKIVVTSVAGRSSRRHRSLAVVPMTHGVLGYLARSSRKEAAAGFKITDEVQSLIHDRDTWHTVSEIGAANPRWWPTPASGDA
jgi:hypothetical protein